MMQFVHVKVLTNNVTMRCDAMDAFSIVTLFS